MRIVFFGDSLTWGGYGGSFVAEVARLLPNHEIINAGNGGDTAVNLLNRLDSVLAQQPDGVFVMVGGNDAIAYSQPETRNYYRRSGGAPDGAMTIDLFGRAYRDLLTRLHAAHVLTWAGLEPNEYSPTVVEAHKQFNDEAREIAYSLRVPVLDLMAIYPPINVRERVPLSLQTIRLIGKREAEGWSDYDSERDREGYTWSFDGLHMTPTTALRVARLVVDFLDLE